MGEMLTLISPRLFFFFFCSLSRMKIPRSLLSGRIKKKKKAQADAHHQQQQNHTRTLRRRLYCAATHKVGAVHKFNSS